MFKDLFDEFPPYDAAELSPERADSIRSAVFLELDKEDKMDNSTKVRKFSRKAIIIPIAAALALGTITAGAAGLGLFDKFGRYFSGNDTITAEAQLGAAGFGEFEKQFDFDDYTVTVNGFMGDRFTILVNYDIDYKAEKYFENGSLKEEFQNRSPVMFFQNNGSGGASMPKVVSVSGSKVSYVQEFEIAGGLEINGNEYNMQIRATFADTTNMGDLLRGTLCEPEFFDASFPVAKELSFPVDSTVTLPDGSTTLLRSIDISPLTVRFTAGNIPEIGVLTQSGTVTATLADGTEIDLSGMGMRSLSGTGHPDDSVYYWNYGTVLDVSQIAKIKFADYTLTVG